MIGIVLYTNPKLRVATVVDQQTQNPVRDLYVPLNIQGIARNSVVSYDPVDNIITSVVAYETNSLKDSCVPGTTANVQPVAYDNRQSAAVENGEIIHQRPKTGFLYLLNGLRAMVGASKISHIAFNGVAGVMSLIASKFNITDNDKINISLSGDANSTPDLSIRIGQLVVRSNSESLLKVSLGGDMFAFEISPNGATIDLFGNEIFKRDTATNNLTVTLAEELRANLVLLAIDVEQNATVNVGGNITVGSQKMIVSVMKTLALTGQTVALLGTSLLRLDGQNITVNATGNMGSGGDINMRAGMMGGMSMKGLDGAITVKGMSLELLGTGENLANANATKDAIEGLYKTIEQMLTMISAASKAPPCAPLAALDIINPTFLVQTKIPIARIPNLYIDVPDLFPNGVDP